MKKIKKYIEGKLGYKNTRKLQYLISNRHMYKFRHLKSNKKIILSLVPNHHNLGDHAIAYASKKFLSDKFPNYEIIEVNFVDTYKYGKCLEKIMNNDDMTCIIGGGNMGNQYLQEENIRRHMISNFSHTKVISLPQTIYFTNDRQGIEELNISKEIYNGNNNLILVAREDKSYHDMKENFNNCSVIKCPDIVFYLNNKLNIKQQERKYIMTCLRKDKETYISLDEKKEFINSLNKHYNHVIISDTITKEPVSQYDREKELYKIWNQFSQSKVVITDRLHGMIFAAITSTPCIVIRSLDHKITESYKWIEKLNYIKLIDNLDFEKIQSLIESMSQLEDLDRFDFDDIYFNELFKYISKGA